MILTSQAHPVLWFKTHVFQIQIQIQVQTNYHGLFFFLLSFPLHFLSPLAGILTHWTLPTAHQSVARADKSNQTGPRKTETWSFYASSFSAPTKTC